MANMHINSKCGWEYKWEFWEDEIIKKHYSSGGYEKILKLLPHRNKMGIQRRASKLGVKYLFYNENYFENIDTPEKAYWLGMLYVDGYITSDNRFGIELKISDLNHLYKLTNALNSNIKINIRKRGNNKSCHIQIKNSKLYKDLEQKGVLRNKTYILQFPNKYQLNSDLYSHFIRGLFDGDGSIVFYSYNQLRKDRNNKTYKRIVKEISFVCKSYDFINYLGNFINEKLDMNINVTHNNRDDIYYLRIANKKDLLNFIDYIYKDAKIYLDRKYIKAQEIKNYCLTH